MLTDPSIRTIAFVGNYPPRQCGIATFTCDLMGAMVARYPKGRCFAVPVSDVKGGYPYPAEVRCAIEEQEVGSYRRAAAAINESGADLVSVQHEFGIFGGPAGSHLLDLLSALRMPVVTTFHTVLREPNADQRHVTRELLSRSARAVVMSGRGRSILQEVYEASPTRIDVIPHGIPDVPFVAPEEQKKLPGLAGRQVILTFGLLSPNKGIEQVLHALPELVAEFPNLVYVVVGATHPHELRARGDSYRGRLEGIVREYKLEDHVMFVNRFVGLQELLDWIGAADVYVTPYLCEAQITSGTLAYAFGAGKAIVSTPYWHAAELLGNDRGVLVPFADSKSIAREVGGLLRNEKRRMAMSEEAYRLGRSMVWSRTAVLYMGSFVLAKLSQQWEAYRSAPAAGYSPRPNAAPGYTQTPLY